MNKLTQISGLNNKLGQNSRTGSNISILVPDELIQAVTQYYVEVKANKETLGNVKKIELVIYEDGDELETIESLRAENKEMRDFIDNMDQVTQNTELSTNKIDSSVDETPLEIEIVEKEGGPSTNGQANIESNLNISTDEKGIEVCPECNSYKLIREKRPNGKIWCDDCGHVLQIGEDLLPPNQRDLKLYEKPCECETPAIVNGKCANCGGVEDKKTVKSCGYCEHRPEDNLTPCKKECLRSGGAKKEWKDLFEIIPKSQRV